MNESIKLHPQKIEPYWQTVWEKERIYQPDIKYAKRPYYNLMMFPYPSAEGLHVGNVYAFTGADINGRYQRMKGYDVFEPIGLDGFGIHSENYAIKIGRNPAEQAKISQKHFYDQLHQIGNSFAWENKLETYDPAYYKWTQWIFVQMFKHGLAYRKKSAVNFCPSCKTVLSDEQVINKVQGSGNNQEEIKEVSTSVCERCGTPIEKREMEQWFFRITTYAEKLLQNTYKKSFQWTGKVKIGQRNWIGKKEGINITYSVVSSNGERLLDDSNKQIMITCFTTAPVNFGATFIVVAPEYLQKHLIQIIPTQIKNEMDKYIKTSLNKSEQERKYDPKVKSGVFTGIYAINHVTKQNIPIWVSDFVLIDVGTGAVQGCPGHDKRDFEFAKKFNLPIIRVVVGEDGDSGPINNIEQVVEHGKKGNFVNSDFLNGLDFETGLQKTMDYFEKKSWGKRVTTYKLRDWCISRQRYWGAPIPMIYCSSCAEKGIGWFSLHAEEAKRHLEGGRQVPHSGTRHDSFKVEESDSMPGWFPVPEEDLPVLLPPLTDWKPEGTGKGPLAKVKEFVNVACPECRSQSARRETDVCDTFLDSSWYFLRYPSINAENLKSQIPKSKQSSNSKIQNPLELDDWNLELPWNPQITRKWLPVTQYIGGAEHTVLHLLYARFITLAFHDWGMLEFDEPFSKFYAHGLIIAEGAKMSKSRGNVIVPDEYIKKYGADTLRTYLMFLGPYDAGGDFRDTGIAGVFRFLARVWRLVSECLKDTSDGDRLKRSESNGSSEVEKTVSDTLLRFMHRTIREVTEDMENFRYNTAIAHIMEYVNQLTDNRQQITVGHLKTLLLLFAPFAPHMTEELWHQLSEVSNQLTVKKTIKSDNRIPTTEFRSIHLHPWPTFDPKYLTEEMTTIIVQVNGKLRAIIKLKTQNSELRAEVEKETIKSEKVAKYLAGKEIRKVIFVPGKLINFVI